MKSNASKTGRFSYYLIAITACVLVILFYTYEFTIRTVPSAITHELMQDFHITAAGLGILSSLFYYGYTAMQIPVGLLFDRGNARKILILSMSGCVLGTFCFGLAPNIYIADAAFFLVGFTASFAFVGCLVMASRIFPSKYYAMVTGFVQLVGCVGAIIGQSPIALLVEDYGWRQTMVFATIVGVVILALMWLFIRDNAQTLQKPISKKQSEMQRLKEVCRNPQTWWIGLYSFTSWAPIIVFAGLWGVPFLMVLYHTNAAVAGIGTTVIWLGIAVGSPLIGWWSDHIKRRCFPLTLCAMLGIVGGGIALYVPNLSWPVMYLLLFLCGLAASGQSLSFGAIQDNHPARVAGTAAGFNNMAVILGGIILHPIVGFILKTHWHGQMQNSVPIYGLSDYRLALMVMPLCSILGLVVSVFFIKETYCRPQYDQDDEATTIEPEVLKPSIA